MGQDQRLMKAEAKQTGAMPYAFIAMTAAAILSIIAGVLISLSPAGIYVLPPVSLTRFGGFPMLTAGTTTAYYPYSVVELAVAAALPALLLLLLLFWIRSDRTDVKDKADGDGK